MYGMKNEKVMEVYEFLKQHISTYGYPPSVREVCSALSIKSTATVYYYFEKLEELGYIRKSRNKFRALEIVNKDDISSSKDVNLVEIPLIGKISAGIPITAIENYEDTYKFPEGIFKGSSLFMLNVSGDSMLNAGINDKDLIVVKSQPTAENGEIVVAFIDGESTVKRFYKKENKFVLHPENELYEDIILDNVEILGVVVGLIRKY